MSSWGLSVTRQPSTMNTLLLLITLAACFNLYITQTPKPTVKKKLLASWTNPPPALRKRIRMTVSEYGHWVALAKFVPNNEKIRRTHVGRFCKCKKPFDKRSLVTRVKRQEEEIKQSTEKKIRREWRRMTPTMRLSFHKHFNNLLNQTNKSKSRIRLFADFHRKIESPGAHMGPAFLPWHREYLFRLENAMADDGYEGGLPYWNSGLDYDLPKPEHSVIFTNSQLGPSNGEVLKPFTPNTVNGDCLTVANLGKTVQRNADGSNKRSLLSRNTIAGLKWTNNYADFRDSLESAHNGVHEWFGVGSHMLDFNCVAFDPIFFLHHAYIDYLWEEYRAKQTPNERETDYPTGTDVPLAHQKHRTMFPFDRTANINGMKNQYTNVYYSYEKSPDKCTTHDSCGSSLLWCNRRLCQAKIKKGGVCDIRLSSHQCYCSGLKLAFCRRRICICKFGG